MMKTKVLTRVTMMVVFTIASGALTIPLPGLPVPSPVKYDDDASGRAAWQEIRTSCCKCFSSDDSGRFSGLSGGRGGIAVFASVAVGFYLGMYWPHL